MAWRSARVVLAAVSPAMTATVLDCLRLRSMARALLFGAPEAEWQASLRTVACSSRSWHVFLYTERCAIAFQQALQRHGLLDQLPPAARDLLARACRAETRHVLAARAQLPELAAIAVELRAPTIVLKGGLAAASGTPPVDLGDIDLLLSEEDAPRFLAELDRRGYATGPDPVQPLLRHAAPRRRSGALDVEVHRHLEGLPPPLLARAWADARPVARTTGLLRLPPADHLWHLLLHAVIQHPERRYCLRDQLLMRAAWGDCSPAERDVLLARIAAHDQPGLLRSALEPAIAVGDTGEGTGLHRRFIAARYALTAAILAVTAVPNWLGRPLKDLTLTLAGDRASYPRYWRELGSPAPNVARRLAPGEHWLRSGHALLVLLRTARLLALTVVGWVLVWHGVRAARSFEVIIDTPREGDRS